MDHTDTFGREIGLKMSEDRFEGGLGVLHQVFQGGDGQRSRVISTGKATQLIHNFFFQVMEAMLGSPGKLAGAGFEFEAGDEAGISFEVNGHLGAEFCLERGQDLVLLRLGQGKGAGKDGGIAGFRQGGPKGLLLTRGQLLQFGQKYLEDSVLPRETSPSSRMMARARVKA